MMNLKRYINEILIESLRKTYIYEMAENRSKYQDILRNLQKQIIQNWCLIRYCSLTNSKLDLRSHWCSELKSYLVDIFYIKLKDDKSNKIKLKATKQQYLEYSELDSNINMIYHIIEDKFKKENLKNIITINMVCEDFASDIEKICELISKPPTNENFNELNNYIYNEI